MPSILVRLRERARTLSFTKTATSASAPATPVPKTKTTTTTQTPTTTHAHPTTPTTTTTASQLDRRILANPDALLTSYENEVTHEQAHDEQRAHEHDGRRRGDRGVESVEIPVGLQPGPRRASGSGSVALARGVTAGGKDEVMHMVESGPQEQGEESGWESGEGRASAMEWSTFGRRHSGAGRTPRLNEFFFDQDAARDVDEKEKDASANGQHTGSSPCNTLSSRTPGTSHESPETFGMRTPVSRVDAHPALTSVLFPTVAESKDDAHEDAQRTYPRRRLRSWALRSGSSSQSLPSTLKLKRTKERTYPNIFRQFHVSPSRKSSNNIDASNLPNSSRSASQSSKNRRSDKTPRRRASAEWYAFQASQNAEGQWPAQVSREILRLSGAGMVEVCATAGASSDSDAVIGPRSGHEVSHLIIPLKPAGSDEARYRDGPSAHIALTKSQSLTQVSPASNHPDASCILSASGPSQPHGLFIDSASPNMAQQPQQEIFQFEKAGRGNGAESALAPKGNGRPQRRPRKPSASSVTHPAKPLQTAEYPPLHIPPSLSVTSPTPRNSAYPSSPTKESDTLQLPTALKAPSAKSQGKRKAEDGDTTPPDVKRATFAPIEPRTVRISDSSQAPSSYASYQNKRARVATTPSPRDSDQGHNYSSVASRASSRSRGSPEKFPARAPSRATSTRSLSKPGSQQASAHTHDRRTSLSGMSIPISALVSPHAPSVARSSKFHMQDPRKPPRARATGWALHRRDEEEERSPVQAWLFFAGFVLFPVWWLASVMGTPETRRVGGSDVEKAVVVDDPQVERDAKAWRFRCRVMAVVSLFTYIPFIVLVAIFAPR